MTYRLVIRDEQMAALTAMTRRAFEKRAAGHLLRHYPPLQAEGSEVVEALVSLSVEQATARGVRSESALLQYLDLTVALGLEIDSAPELSWAAAYLTDEEPGSVDLRVSRLHAELVRRLELAHDNEEQLDAFADEDDAA